jgi:hypothetical protein
VVTNERIQLARSSVQSDRAADLVLHVLKGRLAVKFFDKPVQFVPKRRKFLRSERNVAASSIRTTCLSRHLHPAR